MFFVHRKSHPTEVTLLVLEFKKHPGASVLHKFKPAAAIGLFVAVLDALSGDHVCHLSFEEGCRRIATQGGIALTCLKDRSPEHVKQKHHACHQPEGAPAAGHLALTDQQGDHPADGGDHQALQHLLGLAEGDAELVAGCNGWNQALQFTGAEGNEHGVALRSDARGHKQGCSGSPLCAP